jgi:hypothetical protein
VSAKNVRDLRPLGWLGSVYIILKPVLFLGVIAWVPGAILALESNLKEQRVTTSIGQHNHGPCARCFKEVEVDLLFILIS